jgi:hypothetical protein
VRAGTTIQFIWAGNVEAFLSFGAAPETSYWGNDPMKHPVGEQGTTITYHLRRVPSGAPLDSLSVCASQQLVLQPLLDQPTEAQDAWGHEASAPLGVCP